MCTFYKLRIVFYMARITGFKSLQENVIEDNY